MGSAKWIMKFIPHAHVWIKCECQKCGKIEHHPNSNCICAQCGQIVHLVKYFDYWVDEEGLDEWNVPYYQKQYGYWYCARCNRSLTPVAHTGYVKHG